MEKPKSISETEEPSEAPQEHDEAQKLPWQATMRFDGTLFDPLSARHGLKGVSLFLPDRRLLKRVLKSVEALGGTHSGTGYTRSRSN